jgi:Ca2+-binding EF-hand superfamily protein
MFSRKKDAAEGGRMYYTDYSDAEVARMQEPLQRADRFASQQLLGKVSGRGAAWGEKVDIALKQLNDGLVAQEEPLDAAAAAQPEIKATVMKFECVARAAVTAQLEITKGRRELAIGWIETGQIVQAKLIGTTKQTRRQRVLVDGRDSAQGWVSIFSVDGQQLLRPLQAYTNAGRATGKLEDVRAMYTPLQLQKNSGSINNKQNGKENWKGAAYRLGVEFQYDETFLPPQKSERNQRRNGTVEIQIRKTPEPATEGQKKLRQDDASQRAYASMVQALFTPTENERVEGSSVNRDIGQRDHLNKFPWPPTEDPPQALTFGYQPEKKVGYYARRELDANNPIRASPIDPSWKERPLKATGPSSFIDTDYLAHLAKRYGDEEPLLANLTAERTVEMNRSYSGITSQPSERKKPVAFDVDSVDPGKLNRRRPRTSDGALRLSWAQRCLSHEDAPYKTQMVDYVSTDFEGSEWLTLGDRARPQGRQDAIQKAPERMSFSDAGAVSAPSSLRHKDAKRYSALYTKQLSDQGRKQSNVGLLALRTKDDATAVSNDGGTNSQKDIKVLAMQASRINSSGVYRRGTDSVARRIIEDEVQKLAEEERAEEERIEQAKMAARMEAEAEEARLAAEAKAAEQEQAAAKALREQLETVLEIGGIDKVRSQTLHSEDAEVREAGQELLNALPQNVEMLLYELVKEKALIRMAELEGENAVAMADWSEADVLHWGTGVGLLLHTAVENTDWQIMPTGQCTMSEIMCATCEHNRLDGRDVEKISVNLMAGNFRKAGLTDCAGCTVLEAAALVIKRRDAVLNPTGPAEMIDACQHTAATKIQARQRGRIERRRAAAALQPKPEPQPERKRYVAPSTIQRLVGFGNAEAMARANGVESLSLRIQEHDIAKDTNTRDVEATKRAQKRNLSLTEAQKKKHFGSLAAFEKEAEWTAVRLKVLEDKKGKLEKAFHELHSMVADMYTTIKMVAVRADFDMQSPVIHTLRAGDKVQGLEMRVERSTQQPRLLVEVRHYIRGWVNLMTEGRMTVMVERTSAIEAKARAERARENALDVHASCGSNSTGDQTDPILETYKRKLRGVTYDSGTRTDGRSIQLPWCNRFNKFDTDRSGLLNPTEFRRCIRRFCNEDLLSDHDISQLLAIIDADGSGEISIEEFEDFLHDSPGYREEVNAVAMIQATFRGRKVRQHNSYKASVKTLEDRADAQAEQLKRRMRGIACSRGGIDWHALFCKFDAEGSGRLDQNEFRIACRAPGHGNFSIETISDRELLILFKRFDSDASGTVSYDEFECFLHSGPSADAEVSAVIRIQARQRGKMVRRHRALQGVKMFKLDVERNNWKFEKLTDDTAFDRDGMQSGMWGVLSAALSKHGRGAVIFLSSIDRAEWLAMRLAEKREMLCTVITGNQEPSQRRRALDEWAEARGEHGAPDRDRYGRRRLIIVAEMPTPQALMELRLSDLNLQLAIHFDVPKSWMMYMPRHIVPFPRYRSVLVERGMSVMFYSNGQADSERLMRFESKSGYPLAGVPDDCSRQMFKLVDEMRLEASKKKKALGLAAAAQSKHDGDSWLPDIIKSYEALMERGAAAMRIAAYDSACDIYLEAAKALNWKEESDSDTEYSVRVDGAELDSPKRSESDEHSMAFAAVVSPAALRAKFMAKRAAQRADN